MTTASRTIGVVGALMLSAGCMAFVGCNRIPGRPGPGPEVVRPDEVLAFPTLYKQNCAACHGVDGKNGAAVSLANPVYLAVAGEETLQQAIAKGVPGKLMPPFAMSAGGMLTDAQVTALAQGLVQQWGTPDLLAGLHAPPYLATLSGDAGRGQQAFTKFCATSVRSSSPIPTTRAPARRRYCGRCKDWFWQARVHRRCFVPCVDQRSKPSQYYDRWQA